MSDFAGEIQGYFSSPPVRYLSPEEAAVYICQRLLEGPIYMSQLTNAELPGKVRISDTIFRMAIEFLESSNAVSSQYVNAEGRGRSRKIYSVANAEFVKQVANAEKGKVACV